MWQILLNLINAHTGVIVVAAFTMVSLVLNAVASFLKAVGANVPGWLGTAVTWVGNILHFLNGNTSG